MKQLILIGLILALVGCGDDKITAAGVIAYAQKDDRYYLLLADHTGLLSYRGFAAFGGGLETGETFEQGALREFHEETACHFLGQVQAVSKNYVRNNHYVSFVVRVPFISPEQLNQPQANSACQGLVYSERENWIWVEQQALLKQLAIADDFKQGGVEISLWDKSTVVIKLAQQQGLLP
ncbi:NUDIX hydrolase [Bermanella sp. WJH001]|uniref:NUDIX hydrolase n=1 Tax=Bermanella sp. WJH001 TaxID=3048005 RepID=UPI0024BED91D|nr:NUDIX domain-containing protein [Bermanella sp. WJH001]MDJ1539306.1 NUDIX domain-containing protein [Bermanella sp. WJH001]